MNTILIIIGVLVVGAGVVIYFIKAGKFINSIKIDFKKKQLDKLTNDPEYQKILKKYDIKPINYNDTKLRY